VPRRRRFCCLLLPSSLSFAYHFSATSTTYHPPLLHYPFTIPSSREALGLNDPELFYQPADSAVFAHVLSAKEIVSKYTQSLAQGDRSHYSPRPIYAFATIHDEEEGAEVAVAGSKGTAEGLSGGGGGGGGENTGRGYGYRCSLLLPQCAPAAARYHVSRVCASKKLAQGLAALSLVRQLHKLGELDDNLLVRFQVRSPLP
jgi:hypothetical protein